jgi:5-dehydro-2-deoxygluconokinase
VQAEVLNVLGAGDSFLSGFLHAWLNGESWEDCARSGNACGALVVSRHGCTPAMPTKIELNDYLERAESITRPDKDARIQYLHDASTRAPTPDHLFVLAFDHRRQLEDLVVSTEPPGDKIAAFKSLVCNAVLNVSEEAGSDTQLGIIVDERYGESVLARMTKERWWIGRPVEVPGSRPLELDPRNNIGVAISRWPSSHVVKCLVFYHPDDEQQLRLQQEERVGQLFADCADLGRELLLEVIATSSGLSCDDSTIPRVMRRFYNIGVVPAWWKLESQSDAAWSEIGGVIEQFDPLCHGVLMLGLDAPEDELKKSFRMAAPHPVCKGFAVGRSIFGEAARLWFDGQIDDSEVVRMVAENYETMIRFWQEASAGPDGNASNDNRRATG